jgi:ActR/RegA family two-component response regulator
MANQQIQLLLIDDDVSWQRIYRYYLENDNVMVESATNKDDALRIINQKSFDIAVIDLRLVADDDSNFDGIDVARYIQQIAPKTRIVIKSGYTDETKIKTELDELNVDGVFDKGKSVGFFVDAILNIIQTIRN